MCFYILIKITVINNILKYYWLFSDLLAFENIMDINLIIIFWKK